MACGILYNDAIVIATVKNVDGVGVLDLPFPIYGYDVVRSGAFVTHSLDQLIGQEVMAKVDFRIEDEKEVKKFAGYLGDPKKAAKYEAHYPSKEDFCAALSLKK